MSFAPRRLHIFFKEQQKCRFAPALETFGDFSSSIWICDTIAMLAVCNEIRPIPGIIRAPLSIFNQNSPTRGGGTYVEFKLFMLARVLRVANLWRQGEKVDKIKRGLQDSHPGLNSFHPQQALFFSETSSFLVFVLKFPVRFTLF